MFGPGIWIHVFIPWCPTCFLPYMQWTSDREWHRRPLVGDLSSLPVGGVHWILVGALQASFLRSPTIWQPLVDESCEGMICLLNLFPMQIPSKDFISLEMLPHIWRRAHTMGDEVPDHCWEYLNLSTKVLNRERRCTFAREDALS